MKYIETGSFDPCFNLAVEEYLFNRISGSKETIFMLWQNDPTIVVGRFQNTLEEINYEYVNSRSINVVRRISGGGTVYHDRGNLNYTFIVDRDSEHVFDFGTYCKPIVEVLRQKGVKADFNSRNDLTIEGKKFSGNAQHMRKGKLLHHGTLLFYSDLSVLSSALNVSPEKFVSKGLKSVRSRVTNIKPHLQENMNVKEFKSFLLAKIRFEGQGFDEYKLTDKELEEIKDLADNKYRSWDWVYGKSPEFSEKKEYRFSFGKLEALLNVINGVIQNCKFYGDFFSSGNLENLEKDLSGIKYERESIIEALEHKQIGHYFNGADKKEIIDFLSP